MTSAEARSVDALSRMWRTAPGLPGWLTAVNHKQIGLRFIVTAFAFLLIAGLQAILMRVQLVGAEQRFLGPEAYNQVFTMHGTTMMFLFAIPILEGLGMYLMPLQLGARDLPFPRLNAFSYYVYLAGGVLLYSSFFTGSIPDGGWFAYTPLTSIEFTPDRSMDFWLLGVTALEIAAIVGAIELIVLFLRHRAPGMRLDRVPLFSWAVFITSWMILFAMPAVVAASVMLELERKLGLPFYDPAGGGNPLLWQHLFWIFGHPEVYIMLLPATGIVSAIIPVFVRRRIVGYAYIVAALIAIATLSFGLWVHHMYATGLPSLVLALFAVSSAMIAIPSGVQVFAWLATLWYGRPKWDTALLFAVGGIVIFVAGGITGVMVAVAPFDFQVHDTYFVVAHFHYVILGGVVFPIFGGLHYWFPKFSGRMPGEAWGRWAFWAMFVGFNVTFFVQHVLGLWGMPRRVYTFADEFGWDALNLVSSLGSFLLGIGVLIFCVNLVRALVQGPRAPADPWGSDTLEWAAASPPDPFNFRVPPMVESREPVWHPARAGTDPGTEDVLRSLAVPGGPYREQHITGAVDGRFIGVATLAGNSYWPLWAASAIAVALVGILVDTHELAILGLAGTAVALFGWLRPAPGSAGDAPPVPAPRADQPPEGALDGPGRPAVDHHRLDGVRSSGVWGGIMGALAVGTILLFFLYAYYYLDFTNEPFVPEHLAPPPVLWPLVLIGALSLTLVPAATVFRATVRRDTGHVAAGLGAIAVAGTAFLALGALVAAGQGLSPTSDAYSASVSLVLGFHGFVTATGVVIAAYAAYQAVRMLDHPWLLSASSVAVTWWAYIVLGWWAVGFSVYVYPQLAAGAT